MKTPLGYFRSAREWAKANRTKALAWCLGFGLALYAIHWADQPGLEYIFLPQIGLLFIAMSTAYYFMGLKKMPSLGPKYIWIPMAVIVVSIIARLAIDLSMVSAMGVLYGIILFAVYLASRGLGRTVFIVFVPFVVIVAVSCIYNSIAHPGEITGGIITNYCASAGFMIFGTIVNQFKWQWVLATIALVALFLTGALEVVFIMAALGITLLVKRDWSRKLIPPVALVSVAVALMALLSLLIPLYNTNDTLTVVYDLITGRTSTLEESGSGPDKSLIDKITTNRWEVIQRAVNDIQPLGHGFSPSIDIVEARNNVHNVPLMVTDQIGPVAGLAWLFVTIFCLVKTKWRYAWIAILAMSIFDHYLWTQFAPYWWALAGVSSATILKSDYIFKENIV